MKHTNGVVLGGLILQAISGTVDAQTAPNILLITTDQHSYNMISALHDAYPNTDTYSYTPNLDRLVNSGISFTRTYVANPVSAPSRFSMYSGQYGAAYGTEKNRPTVIDTVGIRNMLEHSAMGNIFSRYGYEVMYGGKRHLYQSSATNATTQNAAPPTRYGFPVQLTPDERDILADSVAQWITRKAGSPKPWLVAANFVPPHDICFERSLGEAAMTLADSLSDPEAAHMVSLCRREADSYDPTYFYNTLAPQLPTNLAPTTNAPIFTEATSDLTFSDSHWRRYRWIYKRMVTYADAWIGQILDAVDANPTLKNNTIIIFTADHGEMQGAHRMTVKNSPYDECQRVPFIIAGPNIAQNVRDNSLVCNGVDLLPTMCELVGIPIPSTYIGVSLARRAWNHRSVTPRNYLYTEGDDFRSVISADGYKLSKVISNNGKQLIDMVNDPRETTNIAASNASKVAELEAVITAGQPKVTIPAISWPAALKDSFEVSAGYATNFNVKKALAWSTLNATNNPNPNLAAGLIWNNLNTTGGLGMIKTALGAQAFAEERTGGNGTQCLKFSIPDECFGTDNAGNCRLNSKTGLISFTGSENETKYKLTFWARLDGTPRKIFIDGGDTLTVTSTWQKFNITTDYVASTASTNIQLLFADQSKGAVNAANNYVVYIDDLVLENKAFVFPLSPSTNEGQIEMNNTIGIHVYPNPASDKIYISSAEKVENVNIYYLNGQKVLDTPINADNSINVSKLSKGIYFLDVKTANNNYKEKVVIK